MNIKSAIKEFRVQLFIILLIFVIGESVKAQSYCSPTFANGCSNWYNQSISLGSVNLTLTVANCLTSDYTDSSAILFAGVPEAMVVTNGVWCGCSVWIDLNNDQVFDSTENLFHKYVGGSPSYTYSFNITVPSNTPPGLYRVRVIAPWGSDGYTVGGTNGYGPCGSFMYGNFTDFSVVVFSSTAGISNPVESTDPYIRLINDPSSSSVILTTKSINDNCADLHLCDVTGKIIRSMKLNSERTEIDISSLTQGIYFITYDDGIHRQNLRFVK